MAVDGGSTVRVDAPLGQPVLFVRAGTVLPLDDSFVEAAGGDGPASGHLGPGHEPRRLALHCFPDAQGSAAGTLYDDAGDGFGHRRLDQFVLTSDGRGGAALTWECSGEYPAPEEVSVVLHGQAVGAVQVDTVATGATVTSRPGKSSVSTIVVPAFAEVELEDLEPPLPPLPEPTDRRSQVGAGRTTTCSRPVRHLSLRWRRPAPAVAHGASWAKCCEWCRVGCRRGRPVPPVAPRHRSS